MLGSEWSSGGSTVRWLREGQSIRVEVETDFVRAHTIGPFVRVEFDDLRRSMFAMGLADAGGGTHQVLDGLVEVTCAMAKREELHVTVRLIEPMHRLDEVRVFQIYPRASLRRLADALPKEELRE
jgi:hypothetical protein